MNRVGQKQGFTIVELLIVVVVIAILAAITIVAYNGIINRAAASAVQSAAQQAAKKISLAAVDNSELYPADTAAIAALGIVNTGDTTYQYTANNTSTPAGFCLTVTSKKVSYYIANSYTYLDGAPVTVNATNPTSGVCPGHGQAGATITNYSNNPSIEVSTAGLFGPGSSTYEMKTDRAYHGTASLFVTMPVSSVSSVGVRLHNTSTTGAAGSLQLSKTYTVSAYVYVPTGTVDPYLSLQGGALVNPRNTLAMRATVKDQWVKIYNTFDTSATPGNINLYILNSVPTVASNPFWVDAIMINEGSSPYPYADGGSSGWSWNGTAGLSTSVGPTL
jgi:prepilin-type N-terminal cleavage/methylation domain-containing protein